MLSLSEGDSMYILLRGKLEVRIDLTKKKISDIEIRNLEFDLELDKPEIRRLIQARLQHAIAKNFNAVAPLAALRT